jgi:hypothetical protein
MRLRPKITPAPPISDSAALIRSARPGLGSRYSGSSAAHDQQQDHHRNADQEHRPHQKVSSTRPPTSGPIAPPTEKLVIQTPIAVVRWRGPGTCADQRQRRRRDGAPPSPAARASRFNIVAVCGEGGRDRSRAERRRANQQQAPPADAIAQRAHRDQRSRDQKADECDDPQQLAAAGLEIVWSAWAPPGAAR